MRAEIQKSAPFKDLLKSWLLDENAHKYLGFLYPKFPPDFLFSLASLDSFPPGEAIGCCRTRGFMGTLMARCETQQAILLPSICPQSSPQSHSMVTPRAFASTYSSPSQT